MITEPTFSGRLREAPRFFGTGRLAANPALFFQDLFENFGDFVHYRGWLNLHAINHPELVKQVLNETHRNFDKQTPFYDRFRNALGNGLVNAEGDHWRRQRKLLQPAFSSGSIPRFFDIMADSTAAMARRWDRIASDGETMLLRDEFADLTLQIAGKSLFSSAFDSSSDAIRRWTRTINTYSSIPPLRLLNNMRVPTFFNLRLRRVLREYREFLASLVDERLTGAPKDDLLSVLLSTKDEETGEPMTLSEVADEVLGLIVGGHETTSTALTWTTFELSRHSDIRDEVIAEIDRVTGGSPLRLEQIPQLVLTERVVLESMRLHPPLWFENRSAREDTEIGGVVVPKGSVIAISRYSLHRHPEFWKAPEAFLPGRFDPEDRENHVDSKSLGTYLPFSRGPRICIGRHFAMMEMVVILAALLTRYRIHPVDAGSDSFSARLTIELRNKLPVRLEKRP